MQREITLHDVELQEFWGATTSSMISWSTIARHLMTASMGCQYQPTVRVSTPLFSQLSIGENRDICDIPKYAASNEIMISKPLLSHFITCWWISSYPRKKIPALDNEKDHNHFLFRHVTITWTHVVWVCTSIAQVLDPIWTKIWVLYILLFSSWNGRNFSMYYCLFTNTRSQELPLKFQQEGAYLHGS
jgi:hypothetical protein